MDHLATQIIYGLDLFGTMSFAFSGAIRVIDRRPDFVGMLILATATAIGGATLRDTVLNRDVMILQDPTYSVLIILSVCISFFFPRSMLRGGRLFQYFDAVGLGVFAAITANVAWGTYHMHPIPMVLVACFCGCAGGVVRDLVIQKPTVILSDELVVTPIILGTISLMIVRTIGFGELVGLFTAIVVAMTLRTFAIIYDLRMPRLLYAESGKIGTRSVSECQNGHSVNEVPSDGFPPTRE
ncbi:MAG: trimeric intracellular cation channel family protein [Thermoguttaceae bacterium]